jgi:hypothetical protein
MKINEVIKFLKANGYQFQIVRRNTRPEDFEYYQNKLGYYFTTKGKILKKYKFGYLPKQL